MNDGPAHQSDPQRERDAALEDATSPPSLEEAQESYDYWHHRAAELPIYRRAERHEAQAMAERWKQRLDQAQRDRFGPGLIEQLLRVLGVQRAPRLPSARRVVTWLTVLAVLALVITIAAIVAVIAYWPHIQPIVNDVLNNQNGGGGG